jgi:CheY-like chemotaxis protein
VELRKLLEGQGHYVISAAKGKDLMDLFDSITVPNLIFLSNKLLFMDAQDLVSVIKGRPAYVNVPIIEIADEGKASLSGVFSTISRPISPSECIRCTELLDSKSSVKLNIQS